MPRRSALVSIILLLYSEAAGAKQSCSSFLNGRYEAPLVANGTHLRTLLRDDGSSPSLLILPVINGTRWLNLGGSVDRFELVVGTPPQTSSDLGMAEALQSAQQQNKEGEVASGVVVSFDPPELAPTAEEQIRGYAEQSLPIWTSLPLESVQERGRSRDMMVNVLWSKSHGLDSVFHRVEEDNVLLPLDLQRVRSIVEDWYRGEVTESDLRFLRGRYNRLQRSASSNHGGGVFTELFMASAVQLMEAEREDGDVDLLPDLQDCDSAYTPADADALAGVLDGDLSSSACTMVTVRAAVLASSSSSVDVVRGVLDRMGHDDVVVLLTSKPYDDLSAEDLDGLREKLGRERTLVEVDPRMEWPEKRRRRAKEPPMNVARPDFDRLDKDDSGSLHNVSIFAWTIIFFLLVLL